MKQVEPESIEPLLQEATEALRRYHHAKITGALPEEVEHLRLLAENLYSAVSEAQKRALGRPTPPLH
ncbi:hypothetical protein [Pseudomonas qingdaonensis]|uniref:hypothetical protein n=1 Tax=Pseudomonas qingdaonensis TaxID=2056231 RepID=UPI002E18B62F|nr:hypothetical protein [Pseudomonas qingdaonensis]